MNVIPQSPPIKVEIINGRPGAATGKVGHVVAWQIREEDGTGVVDLAPVIWTHGSAGAVAYGIDQYAEIRPVDEEKQS